VRKNQAGTTIVEPRTPRPGDGDGPAAATPPRVAPNPFGAALETEETTIVAQAQVIRKSAAAAGNVPAGNTPRNTTTYADDQYEEDADMDPEEAEEEEKEYRAVIIRHVYAGGLAKLFAGGTIITTDQMVSPKSSGGGGGGGFSPIGGGNQQQNGFQNGYNNTGIDPNTGLPINGGGGFNNGGGYNTGTGTGGGFNTGTGIGGIGTGIGGVGTGMISDRNLKENLSTVDTKSVLDKVASLPIQTWNYKDQGEAIRHIGPMAQDFAGAFGVGEDDRRINMVDANGVTLASIQALYQITLQQSEQIKALQQELAKLQAEKQPVAAQNAKQIPAETPAR